MSVSRNPKWVLLLQELRAPFFTASIIPVLVGSACAYFGTGQWHWPLFCWTALGVMCIHAGANVANDYFDHRSGNDAANTDFVRPFTGGSRMIQDKQLTPREVLTLSLGCFAAGGAVGLYVFWKVGPPVIWLGLIGMAGGFFYTAPPVKLSAQGLGEPVIALLFGVLPAVGAYYVQTRRFSGDVLVLSLSLAVLVLLVLFINQFQDYRADAATGKRTWVVRLGLRRSAWCYAVLVALWPLPLLVAVAAGWYPAWLVLALAPGLLAAWTVPRVLRYYAHPRVLAPANALTIAMHAGVGIVMVLVLIGAR
ncbi:MAG: prenyltransferase [Kiritimatiellae bacterium]|nr:prenyltransferase [Kiritimatiellia bacterium]